MSKCYTTKELVRYFNKLNGKSVQPTKIIDGLKNNFGCVDEQIEQIFSSDEDHDAEGTKKMCAYLGNKKVLAMLKSFIVFKPYDQECLNGKASAIIKENDRLMAQGAKIPKVHSLFFADGRYFELQNAAEGDIISVLNLENFGRRVLKTVDKISPKEYKELFKKSLFEYNLKQQKLMLNLPQEKFDELFNTYKILNDNFYGDYDSHSENVLVSEKGFMVVDIDYDQMIFNTTKRSLLSLYNKFLRPFSNATVHTNFLTNNQIETLQNNNVEILKKLVTTASNNNIALYNDDSFIKNTAPFIVGDKNWKNYCGYILEPQRDLLFKELNRRK